MPLSRILIVEDEPLIAFDLRESLEDLGYEVVALVSTGAEGILQAEKLRPDIVLMDIQLEGKMDGVEATQQIQAKYQIPVVYLTAKADQNTLERIADSQPYGYVLKPFSDRILATHIEIALARHRTELAGKRALVQANRSIQQKSDHLAIATHEFRNPISVIKLTADVMEQMGDQLSSEKRQIHLDRIRQAADTLTFLLEDIMLLEQITAESLDCSPVPLDLVALCQDQIETWQFASEYHCDLTFSASETTCFTTLDQKVLWHLLNNLLSNAVKYSPQGGSVCLGLNCTSTSINLEVQDHGIGIPAEDLDQLFQPYHRAQNVGEIPGTGLGLAIAKRCVDLYQGQIAVKSQLGEGTTVTVSLPRPISASAHPTAP